MQTSLPNFEANVFGQRLYDTLTTQCCQRLQSCLAKGDFELEAKIGCFSSATDPSTRYTIPLVAHGYCMLASSSPVPYMFRSGLSEDHFSTLCNNLKQRLTYTHSKRVEPLLEYKKTHTIDAFYRVEGKRVRVTRDFITKEVKECIEKVAVGDDINILDNANVRSSKYSFRISAKKEVKVPLPPPDAVPVLTREKVRRSFTCGIWSLDLTEVMSGGNKTFEVEVEMRAQYLELMRRACHQALTGGGGTFMRMVGSLLTTVQSLIMATSSQFIPIPSDLRPAKHQRLPDLTSDAASNSLVQLPEKSIP